MADNQTVVLGGLVGTTDTEVETKLPILGDLPLIGVLFRGKRTGTRKTNMMIFLTPHIIDDEDDMFEVQRVKEAQRQEFLRRFYGKSRDEYMDQIRSLLRYSMNDVDEPSLYRGPSSVGQDFAVEGEMISEETIDALNEALSETTDQPGAGAGDLPEEDGFEIQLPEEGDAMPVEESPADDSEEPAIEEAP